MKFLLPLFVLLAANAAEAQCVLKNQLKNQRHFLCQVPGTQKTVNVLDLKGGFAETAYYHGYFLKNEIESGVLSGVQSRSEKAFAELDKDEYQKIMLIKKCVVNNYRASVSDEFKDGLRNLHKGLQAAGSRTSWKKFEEANYMVEFSIFADAMQRQMEEDPSKEKLKVFASCAPYFVGDAIKKPFKKIARGLRSIKMGCTGISASAEGSADGSLVHGRNFDTGLLGFYEKHQTVVINTQKNGHVSVGISSAGLHYAGGISGFNSAGLSVSLHELQTEGVRMRYADGTSDIAPYLLHSVLMKAKNLDQAIELIKERKGFGAWTFFISDSKNDEVASIELSGHTVRVARRAQKQFLGQSNHFIAKDTRKEGYEYSLNKTLETRARLTHVSRTLQENFGHIDYQWVINRLSGHYDELVGPRSFGRTTTKVYTAATHVMVPARQEWWMSVSETYPTNRSHFVGFQLTPQSEVPVQILGVTKAYEDTRFGNWYNSMNFYVQAYLANEEDHSSIAGIDKTLGLMDQAIAQASLDNVYEFPYHFMWARLKIARAALELKAGHSNEADLNLHEAVNKLVEIRGHARVNLHAYEKFQLDLWQLRAERLKSTGRQFSMEQSLESAAVHGVQELIALYPQQKELKDLKKSLSNKALLPLILESEIRFGTVE